ncbi:hypothetical protein HYV82_05605 [Candidatus Woesearchaeota archaeon]|nr:hypothetical protein [Candidatus Woesearchaeota archaeon]
MLQVSENDVYRAMIEVRLSSRSEWGKPYDIMLILRHAKGKNPGDIARDIHPGEVFAHLGTLIRQGYAECRREELPPEKSAAEPGFRNLEFRITGKTYLPE